MNTQQVKYYLEKNGEFSIDNYNLSKPWASFFPGIAGVFGIPLWAFYVNRGQCISSFGVRSKDEAIMEFLPANKAYQLTPSLGFRTFIKTKGSKGNIFYEPFCVGNSFLGQGIKNKMSIKPFELKIIEVNPSLGLEVEVTYFSVPNMPFAALAREVAIKNISRKDIDLEFLDGLSVIVPYGVNNWFLKEMSRTIEAWMTVEGVDNGLPLFKLTTDPRDSAQVVFVKGAHFYRGFAQGQKKDASKVIVDPVSIFGNVSDFSYPQNFLKAKSFKYPSNQVAKDKTPCAFSFYKTSLKPGEQKRFFSLIGHIFADADIKKYGIGTLNEDFISQKRLENQELISSIMDRIFTSSGIDELDLYARQTYLDNVLRGGLPYSVSTGEAKKNVYVFSRKHGDLERDYNRFSVPSVYFSQGEGNYRDINQNRRSDIFFNPSLCEKVITDFMCLIQLDGYNPLIFKGEKFVISEEDFYKCGLAKKFNEKDALKLAHILSMPFTLGDILSYLEANNISFSCSLQEFVAEILAVASVTQDAFYGEGYWSDHWAYNTDLLENFIALYPEKLKWLLFEKMDFTYFDTHAFVKPREERYVIQHGEVRQYHSIHTDEEKNIFIHKRHSSKNLVRDNNGDGNVLKVTLISKFLCLIINKLATLDAYGAGVEMEADKPNWYDALNGLPGLIGSSISETFELKRLVELFKKIFSSLDIALDYEILITSEMFEFFSGLFALLKNDVCDFEFWDKANEFKEGYRLKVRRGVNGELKKLAISEINDFFGLAIKKLNAAVAKSYDEKNGFYCTYFSYRVVKHELVRNAHGKDAVIVKEFAQAKLPLFLEGFVHALKTERSKAKDIYNSVKKSPLYDKKLKMYKVNASLEKESFELGRARAFTPGWLENESIWLHMEYKYVLELLKNGLYDEFYKDFFDILVPFQKPAVYGRSILENSSFIVSSVHPDVSIHGAGFVARLSGSTAEFINMWLLMNIGPRPFFLDEENKLSLRFNPALSAKLFTKKSVRKCYVNPEGENIEKSFAANTYSFLFLGQTFITYLNPGKKDTFGKNAALPKRIRLFDKNILVSEFDGAVIKAPYAQRVRNMEFDRIEILLG